MCGKAQLADDFLLEVVPNHDLVRGPFGAVTAAHQGHNIGLVDHLSDGNSSIQITLEMLHDFGIARTDCINSKAVLRSNHEAIVLLVEADRAARLARRKTMLAALATQETGCGWHA